MSWERGTIYGWDGWNCSTEGVAVWAVPGLGGRIISLTVGGQELFFVQPEHQGETFDSFPLADRNHIPAVKQSLGFRVWGGDKTWVAPEQAWVARIPPLDLDAGSYRVDFDGPALTMTSPHCRETGLQIIRRVEVRDPQTVILDQTIRNVSAGTVEWGIWDVSQCRRPFDVSLPSTTVRAYTDPGYSSLCEPCRLIDGQTTKIICHDRTHFKFGGLLNAGRIDSFHPAEHGLVQFTREFPIDPQWPYAHGAMAEVYNSMNYPYGEVEVHGPLVRLEPGAAAEHQQIWTLRKHF